MQAFTDDRRKVTTISHTSWWWPCTPNNDISHNPLCTSFKWTNVTNEAVVFLVYFVGCFLNGGTLEMLPPMTRFTLDLKHKQKIMYMYMYIFSKNICWFINKFLQSKHFQFSKQSGQKLYSYFPMVGGSFRVLWLLPPLKLVAMISLKYCWKWS